MLLLLQFLFNHSEFFTEETKHIVPPCNEAKIPNFLLEFWKNKTYIEFYHGILLKRVGE